MFLEARNDLEQSVVKHKEFLEARNYLEQSVVKHKDFRVYQI